MAQKLKIIEEKKKTMKDIEDIRGRLNIKIIGIPEAVEEKIG